MTTVRNVRDFAAVLLVLVGLGLSGCAQPTPEPTATFNPNATIESVIQEHGEDWLAVPGVEALAQHDCDGQPCVMVIVAGSVDEVRGQIPEDVDGFPVVVGEFGDMGK